MPVHRKPICIPVRWENGQWKIICEKTGEIRNGAMANLYVDPDHFVDQALANRWKKSRAVTALPQGTELRVALTIHSGLKESLRNFLVSSQATPRDPTSMISVETQFVSVHLIDKTETQQARESGHGGLWLCLDGMDVQKIECVPVKIPSVAADKPVDTLNQAFTRLSEVFEPWRASHTGNIYSRIYYLESNARWYPLDNLRDRSRGGNGCAVHMKVWERVDSEL